MVNDTMVNDELVTGPTEISFTCTACGRCCNSPPRLSLPELFRFQHAFIGSLSLTRIAAGGLTDRASLLDRLAIRAPGPGGTTHVALMPRGYGYEADTRCPALASCGSCALQESGKPAQCIAVPLDPLAPDALQALVLRERMADPAFAEIGCIAAGRGKSAAVLTRGHSVVDAGYARALAVRRRALAEDTAFWGRAVYAALRARGLPDLPPGGELALSMTSALLVVAGISDTCRTRCLEFVAAQICLIEHTVQRARDRRRLQDRPATKRLLAWADEYRALRITLAVPPAFWLAAGEARTREAWLGVTDTPVMPDLAAFNIPAPVMA